MWEWGWVERKIGSLVEKLGADGGAWVLRPGGSRWHVGVALGVTAMAGLALAATLVISSRRGSLKSPWSRRKRKRALTRHQWYSFFTPEGKLRDGGLKFLKKVRSGGVDPSIRAEVWPFLLGVYNLNSSRAERNAVRQQKRKEYEKLRRRCRRLLKLSNEGDKELKEIVQVSYAESPIFIEGHESPGSEDVFSARESPSVDRGSPVDGGTEQPSRDETSASNSCNVEEEDKSGITHVNDASAGETESSDTESSTEDEPESDLMYSAAEGNMETDPKYIKITSIKGDNPKSSRTAEDYATWQRIIRLDAIRANVEWVIYSPAQALVSEDKALKSAVAVGLKDYDHLEPCRIYHAARLVAILEAYALYDPEIGYCQGMSDLLSPILAVMEEDYEAFWCFVGFMRKARHNFRLDEVGIRRQLNIVSKIIKSKDLHLFRHLEKLQAEDCFFVYRMVVVLFRRELTFEQTVCLWEVMWADQAAIRAGIGKSAWGRIRLRAPPTEDLLLYAIAACVLQRRKLIIETYSSMDEIIRACNNMAGQLDVWKLLDDAHDLVVTLHDKIE
ncbi:small G protein signaling modulator 2-like isoform X2 [Phoenix dactylifera]|uniref:Small G protein signaling modulator 2-like isoform X2 n=1 Tax=Phoenix dactylifera TaxID=42345 RepID=A0A8B7C2Y5_PHODC|nr:small G protein signaling modulator 2-like isoform X2 [Phoenix dactylifera]